MVKLITLTFHILRGLQSSNLVPRAFLRLGGEKPWERGWENTQVAAVDNSRADSCWINLSDVIGLI